MFLSAELLQEVASLWFQAPLVMSSRLRDFALFPASTTETNRMITEKLSAAAESFVALNAAMAAWNAASRVQPTGWSTDGTSSAATGPWAFANSSMRVTSVTSISIAEIDRKSSGGQRDVIALISAPADRSVGGMRTNSAGTQIFSGRSTRAVMFRGSFAKRAAPRNYSGRVTSRSRSR